LDLPESDPFLFLLRHFQRNESLVIFGDEALHVVATLWLPSEKNSLSCGCGCSYKT